MLGGLRYPYGRKRSVRLMACTNANRQALPRMRASRTCPVLWPAPSRRPCVGHLAAGLGGYVDRERDRQLCGRRHCCHAARQRPSVRATLRPVRVQGRPRVLRPLQRQAAARFLRDLRETQARGRSRDRHHGQTLRRCDLPAPRQARHRTLVRFAHQGRARGGGGRPHCIDADRDHRRSGGRPPLARPGDLRAGSAGRRQRRSVRLTDQAVGHTDGLGRRGADALSAQPQGLHRLAENVARALQHAGRQRGDSTRCSRQAQCVDSSARSASSSPTRPTFSR